MKTLGDLGVLGEKKGKLSSKDFNSLSDTVYALKQERNTGYNLAREEDNKIPLKDILSKIEWDEERMRDIINENCVQDFGSEVEDIENLVSILIKELPNMVNEEMR